VIDGISVRRSSRERLAELVRAIRVAAARAEGDGRVLRLMRTQWNDLRCGRPIQVADDGRHYYVDWRGEQVFEWPDALELVQRGQW
jgi:hypothetical protein